MRPLTSLSPKPDRQTPSGAPQPPSTSIVTSQRDLVVWSLLVCPEPAKPRP